ncbi:SHOCT domain-containing protein [Streptomyces sp. NPDC004111]|uniref:SHOCT domain-containing protein n=1 Tax=Streptomyces sp. NPDC004111 TaxID=3364690 RepID=UPI0036986E03
MTAVMYWPDHGVSGWGWAAMSFGTIVFGALVVFLGVMACRALNRDRRNGGSHAAPSAEQVLAERYARGEVDEDEYRGRLSVLRDPGGHPPPHTG